MTEIRVDLKDKPQPESGSYSLVQIYIEDMLYIKKNCHGSIIF